MDDSQEHDGKMDKLRETLEKTVNETGSLTDERVLTVSKMLGKAILAYMEKEKPSSKARTTARGLSQKGQPSFVGGGLGHAAQGKK